MATVFNQDGDAWQASADPDGLGDVAEAHLMHCTPLVELKAAQNAIPTDTVVAVPEYGGATAFLFLASPFFQLFFFSLALSPPRGDLSPAGSPPGSHEARVRVPSFVYERLFFSRLSRPPLAPPPSISGAARPTAQAAGRRLH